VIAELVRLQTAVGPSRVRRRRDAARSLGPHLAARHRALQQVKTHLVIYEAPFLRALLDNAHEINGPGDTGPRGSRQNSLWTWILFSTFLI